MSNQSSSSSSASSSAAMDTATSATAIDNTSNVTDSKSSSLDAALVDSGLDAPSNETFYWKVNDAVFSIPVRALKMIPTFHALHETNPTENLSAEHALPVKSEHMTENVLSVYDYEIKTVRHFEVIQEYINHHADNLEKEPYVKAEPVKTGDAKTLITDPFDLKLIEDYLQEGISKLTEEEKKTMAKNDHCNRYAKIKIFNQFMKTALNYLDMRGLTYKILAYIACMMHQTSVVDLSEATGDPYFRKIQEDAIRAFEEANKDKIAALIGTNKTGQTTADASSSSSSSSSSASSSSSSSSSNSSSSSSSASAVDEDSNDDASSDVE